MANSKIRFFNKNIKHTSIRCIISFIVLLCTINIYAQKNLHQRLSEIMISKNAKACKKIINEITDEEISQMKDSTLFYYHYLAAWNASETNQIEKTINHLTIAKEVCENKIGIHNEIYLYFEIIRTIGENYEDLGKEDEALLWYEEGILKGLPYANTNDKILNSYLGDIAGNAAYIYENKGYPEMARYISGNKPKDYIGSFEYACDLMSQATDLDNEGKSIDAINLLNEAKEIFIKNGDNGKDMLQPLYRRYLRCYATLGDISKIDKLLKNKNKIFYDGKESYLVTDMSSIISTFLFTHHDIKSVNKYYNYLYQEYDITNANDKTIVYNIGKNVERYTELYNKIDSIEQSRSSFLSKKYEWGLTSLQLANLLIKVQRDDEGYMICKDVYTISSQLNEDPQNLHWYILKNLADYSNINKDYANAERYLKEQLKWLDTHNMEPNTEEKGWVYNKLGIAYLNNGNYDESRDMFNKAENILIPIYSKKSHEYATILHNQGRLAQLCGELDKAKRILTEAQQLQISLEGKANDKTVKYLEEVEQAIKVRL